RAFIWSICWRCPLPDCRCAVLAWTDFRRRTGRRRRRRAAGVRPSASAAPEMAERGVVAVRTSAGLRQRARITDRVIYDRFVTPQHDLATHRKGPAGPPTGSVSGLDFLSRAIPRPQALLANVLRHAWAKSVS